MCFLGDYVFGYVNIYKDELKVKDYNIYHEYEFIYSDNKNNKHGIIDLLLENEKEYIVIDYKTKEIDKDSYYQQVGGYMNYIKTITNKKVSGYIYSIIEDKYYDKYTNSGSYYQNYNGRILGDATAELGPFGSQVDPDNSTRYVSSWYGDYAHNVTPSDPWFYRAGNERFLCHLCQQRHLAGTPVVYQNL